MSRNYPKFTQAQRERGPYFQGQRTLSTSSTGFAVVVFLLAGVTFSGIFFSDRVPGLNTSAVQFSRSFDRDHAPLPGASYSGCNDARADGVAPIYSDEPGYRSDMDGDGDGIACEPHR
ncbi:excalibur calcium-binding domain-containing protein [Sphingomonas sp.]|uniref:excalibur calcium-binding domain-containing protein n=1 Tax=Sphingomonas sp. TaxID=28214 RepID=UPI0025D78152|nr:excalibur calcium-binding domain-containing protein [Sphingomonas sp.]